MKVLIVSDTHGLDENLEETVLREAPFDYLIHCGDVEGREIFIEALAECPCTIVAGNNDFFTDLPYEEEVTLEGHKILVTHGHHYFVSRDYDKLVENAQAKGCKIAMYGHTHMPVIENEDGILVINPGSLTYPRQRGRRPSYAVMQIEEGKDPQVEIRSVSYTHLDVYKRQGVELRKQNIPIRQTLEIYRSAVSYLIGICLLYTSL